MDCGWAYFQRGGIQADILSQLKLLRTFSAECGFVGSRGRDQTTKDGQDFRRKRHVPKVRSIRCILAKPRAVKGSGTPKDEAWHWRGAVRKVLAPPVKLKIVILPASWLLSDQTMDRLHATVDNLAKRGMKVVILGQTRCLNTGSPKRLLGDYRRKCQSL